MLMKLFFVIFSVALIFIQGSLSSILPPLYHTLAEFKAIIESPKLTELLQSGEAIVLVKREGNKRFIIITNKNKLVVDVIIEPTDRYGPAKFHLDFHNPEALE